MQNINLLVADVQLRRRSSVDVQYCRHAFSRCQCFNVHNATTVVLAAVWLAERPGLHRITATIVGFAGALIILRPGIVEVSAPALAALFAAAMFSGALIGSKMLTATENPNAMVFYLYTLMIHLQR